MSNTASPITYCNRFLGGALVGGQVVWSVAVLPTYRRLTPDEYLKVHTLLTWYGDALMPALGLSTTITGFLRYRQTGERNALIGTAALAGASIAAARNLGINHRLRALRAAAPETLAADALARDRDRWAAQHLVRSAGGLTAFLCFLQNGRTSLRFGRPRGGRRLGELDVVAAGVLARSGREVLGHLAMMRGRGRQAGMAEALGIRGGGPARASVATPAAPPATPAVLEPLHTPNSALVAERS